MAKTPRNTRKPAQKVPSVKEQAFINEYLKNPNAYKSAIAAGYAATTADKQAPLWVGKNRASCPLNKRHVWDAVQSAREELQQRAMVDAERVIRETGRLAFFDVRKLLDADGKPKAVHELDDDTAAAIAGIEIVHIGNSEAGIGTVVKYKIADKNSALEKLFRHLGLYEKDNKQQTDPLAVLLERICGGTSSAFQPVAQDPEAE